MTDARINELLALCERASKGPWTDASGKGSAVVRSEAEGCAIYINVRSVEVPEAVARWQADAAFIAASRTALPEALEEIRRLSKILVEITLAAVDQVGGAPAVADARDAEIGRLRELAHRIERHSNAYMELDDVLSAQLEAAAKGVTCIDCDRPRQFNDGFPCEKCRGRGFVLDDPDTGAEVYCECDDGIHQRRTNAAKDCGLSVQGEDHDEYGRPLWSREGYPACELDKHYRWCLSHGKGGAP